MTGVLLVFLF